MEARAAERMSALGMVMVLLLSVLVMGGMDSTGRTKAGELDLFVEDIWMMGEWGVACRIGKVSGSFYGSFSVNLSYWGMDTQSHDVYWSPDENDTMEVVFESGIQWNGTMVIIGVELVFSPFDNEQNRSNNKRTERWFRDLPDLYVRSVFRAMDNGSTVAIIGNRGMAVAPPPVPIGLYVNDTLVDIKDLDFPMAPGETVTQDFDWTWDPNDSPVRLSVFADPYNWVPEMDDDDNRFNITWERLAPFEFSEPPNAVHIGLRNATIRWRTSVPARCVIRYGRSTANMVSLAQTGPSREGSAELQGLSPFTQYTFEVLAYDERGREIGSDTMTFSTKHLIGTVLPVGSFGSGPLRFGRSIERIPFEATDDVGIQRIDVHIDGTLVKTQGGMGSGRVSGIEHDFSVYTPGSHQMDITVTNVEGNSKVISSSFDVLGLELGTLQVEITTPSDGPIRGGILDLAGSCRDPGTVKEAAWLIDGVEVARVSREMSTSSLNCHYTWFTIDYQNGLHTVTLQAWNGRGETKTDERSFLVQTLVAPGDPCITVVRGDVVRSGTKLISHLTVTNVGQGAARDTIIGDVVCGFVPLDGDEGTRSLDDNGHHWIVTKRVGLLLPGASVNISYQLIPAFNPSLHYCVGFHHTKPSWTGTYTTYLTYKRLDGVIEYGDYRTLPQGRMGDGRTVEQGVYDAFGSSNYLLMTCGTALYGSLPPRASTDELLLVSAKLLDIRNGVFGFVNPAPANGFGPLSIKDELMLWAIALKPGYSLYGYLAILGEDEIIPAWDYGEYGSSAAYARGSDHGYSFPDATDRPQVVVGRFIGRTAEELLVSLRTALGVAQGTLRNDPSGKATLITTAGEGAETFQRNGEDLAGILGPLMQEVRTFPRGQMLVRGRYDVTNDGKRTHMVAGDIELDGMGEVVLISPSTDSVTILSRNDGSRDIFRYPIGESDVVLLGNFLGDGRKEILLAQTVNGIGRVRAFDRSGNLLGTFDPGWEVGDPICIQSSPAGMYDYFIIGSVNSNQLRIHSGSSLLFQFGLNQLTISPNSIFEMCDYNMDGAPDLVHYDHLKKVVEFYTLYTTYSLRFYSFPAGSIDDFAAGAISSGGCMGSYLFNKQNGVHWFDYNYWDARFNRFFYGSARFYLPLNVAYSADVMELGGISGPYEIAVCLGEPENKVMFLDLANVRDNFQKEVAPFMVNRDLLFFRDHGDVDQWCDIFFEDEIGPLGIRGGTHRPVVFSSACLTGRYHDNDTSIARSFMINGAGVFIGATEPSFRSTNNGAISVVEDWSKGMPIGVALKKYKRSITDEKWIKEYNLYGDPAFGTTSRQYIILEALPMFQLASRSPEQVHVELGEVLFINVTGGIEARFPECRQYCVEGYPSVPYTDLVYEVPYGSIASSVDVEMSGDWELFHDVEVPPFPGELTDAVIEKPRSMLNLSGTSMDPEDPWYPGRTFEWTVTELQNGNTSLRVRLYPFQYDPYSFSARYCRDWKLNIELDRRPARIGDVKGPNGTLLLGEDAVQRVEVEPIGAGGIVSITFWVENGTGSSVKELRSSLLDVNSTTSFTEVWDIPPGASGTYVFCIELRSESGRPLGIRRSPFSVGAVSVEMGALHVSSDPFNGTSALEVWTEILNKGELIVSGQMHLSLMDLQMKEVLTDIKDVTLGPAKTMNISALFDMDKAHDDHYFIMARFSYSGISISQNRPISRDLTPPGPPGLVLMNNYSLSGTSLFEGEPLFVNGTVSGGNGSFIPDVSVAAWLDDGMGVARTRTDVNGEYHLLLHNLTTGNRTLTVFVFAGNVVSESRELVFVKVRSTPDGNDTDDDGKDDDDVPDDGDDDNGEDVEDDDGRERSFSILCLISALILIFLLLMVVMIISAVAISSNSRKKKKELEE